MRPLQGVLVRRHKAPKDASEGGGFFSPSDFAVGGTATVYGRTYMLVDADAFTRNWFTDKGGFRAGRCWLVQQGGQKPGRWKGARAGVEGTTACWHCVYVPRQGWRLWAGLC